MAYVVLVGERASGLFVRCQAAAERAPDEQLLWAKSYPTLIQALFALDAVDRVVKALADRVGGSRIGESRARARPAPWRATRGTRASRRQ